MLNKRYRLLAALLAVFCLVPIFSLGVGASASTESDADQAMYVEKYVSVLYDNSGSMLQEDRTFYANYAFQMMVSMMNAEDELWVVPMNSGNDVATINNAVKFTFTDNRESDINSFVSSYLDEKKPLAPVNGAPTPLASMPVAIERLFKTDDISDYNASRDRKHWLVVLTDGKFTDESRQNHMIETTVNHMVEQLEANEELNIIYVGMGSAADLSQETYIDEVDGNKVKQNVLYQRFAGRFTALMANTPEKVVAAMHEVVNMMSDRYTLENDREDFITLSDDKKTATVKLSYVPFPLNSVSFAVQNFGGKLTKATYAGKTFTPDNCIITPPSELGMKSGATGVIRDTDPNPMLFNTSDTVGELVLYFDQPVEESNIVLMAEPSLYIRSVFEYQEDGKWVEGTRIDLMKRLQEGDKIKVGFRVYNGATGKPFTDLAGQLPGETYGTVYVGGALVADKLKGMSDEITLGVGSNEIKMSVSLMDGIYRLEETVDIRIIGSTAGYSMTATYTPPTDAAPHKSSAVFTPKKETALMTKEELSTYTATVSVKNMEGVEVSTGAKAVLRDDGTYLVELDLSSQPFGEYSLALTLTDTVSPVELSAQIPDAEYYPASVSLTVDGESEISKTQNGFNRGQYRAFTFLLTADGKAFDFNNGLLDYELTFGKTVIDKDMYTVSGNKLSFVPDKDTVGALLGSSPADYKITVSVSSDARPALTATAEATLKITATKLEVIVLKNEMLPIDRFDIQDTPAEVYFAVNCDDAMLTQDELAVALGQKEKDAATETVGTLTIESEWCEKGLLPVNLTSPEITTLTVNGETTACVKVVIEPGHLGFFREHFTSMLISKDDKPITATYTVDGKSATAETVFVLAPASAWSYIWRVLVILLWIHIILGIVLNPSVPRHKSGYLIALDVSGPTSSGATVKSVTAINRSFMQKAIPLRWFIPFYPVMAQKKIGDSFITFDFRHVAKKKNGKMEPLDKTKSKAVCLKHALVFSVNNLEGDGAAQFKTYLNSCKQQPHPTKSNMKPSSKLTNGMLRAVFAAVVEHEDVAAAANYVPKNGVCNGFSGGDRILAFYTTKDAGGKVQFGKLNNLVFFVPKK